MCFVGKNGANTGLQITLSTKAPRRQCSEGAVFSLLELTQRVGLRGENQQNRPITATHAFDQRWLTLTSTTTQGDVSKTNQHELENIIKANELIPLADKRPCWVGGGWNPLKLGATIVAPFA